MDGTLIDSRELIVRAFEDILAEHNVEVTRQQIIETTGKPIQAMYGILAPSLDPAGLEVKHLAHHKENIHLLKGYQDVNEVLESLQKEYKLGIFTGFDKTTHERLQSFGLTDYFQSVVECTMYTAHKPDPEGLLLCMDQLGVSDPVQVVYVGDGVSDIVAGKNAGVKAAIGITHGFSDRATLENAGADYVIDSLAELRPLLKEIDV